MRFRRFVPVFVLPALLSLGCGDDDALIVGEEGTLGGEGRVWTWARRDSAGAIAEVGISFDAALVDGAAAQTERFLEFPEAARAETFVDHLGIDFNPAGHGPPGVYDVAHFDLHFYGISAAEREAIDCAAQPMPAPARLPAPFFIPGTGPEPSGTCVPGMGVHAMDGSSPELDQQAPQPFDETFILGYTSGKLAFLEPMITQEMLSRRAAFDRAVPALQEIGRATRWPQRVTVSYDDQAAEHRIVLSDFSAIDR